MDPRQLPGPRRLLRSALPGVPDFFTLRCSILTGSARVLEAARTAVPRLPGTRAPAGEPAAADEPSDQPSDQPSDPPADPSADPFEGTR